MMTYDEYQTRALKIVADLYDLKEDVLEGQPPEFIQGAFDGGMLEAAVVIIDATLDDNDSAVKAEKNRRPGDRLYRVLRHRGQLR